MTIESFGALFLAMTVMAALPSLSVLLVCSRAVSGGLSHGIAAAAGVVMGDVIYILIAILGLSGVVLAFEPVAVAIPYLGAALLVWIAWSLIRKKQNKGPELSKEVQPRDLGSSFTAGLLLTLADQKAILFYLGFLPAFVELERVTLSDTLSIMAVAILAVGGMKVVYAVAAEKAKSFLEGRMRRRIEIVAGVLLIIIALAMVLRS